MDIRSDRQKGLSYTEIARRYNIDPRTAKKYAESEMRPVYSLSGVKPSKLDPYKEQITVWLEEAPYSAERILEKIREQGFEGGHSIVREFVRNKKEHLDEKATVRFETMPGLQGQMDWAFFEDHTVVEEGTQALGKYGMMRKNYLREHRPILHSRLTLQGKLFSHCLEIEQTANSRLELMKQSPPPNKATDPMGWTAHMNSLKLTAEETIVSELIHS